jgi:hypothetical protein
MAEVVVGIAFLGLAFRLVSSRRRAAADAAPAWLGALDRSGPMQATVLALVLSCANPKNLALILGAAVLMADTTSGNRELAVGAGGVRRGGHVGRLGAACRVLGVPGSPGTATGEPPPGTRAPEQGGRNRARVRDRCVLRHGRDPGSLGCQRPRMTPERLVVTRPERVNNLGTGHPAGEARPPGLAAASASDGRTVLVTRSR